MWNIAGQSEGAFDITVGPLMKVWGFYKGTGHLPHKPEIAAALAKVGYRHIVLDKAAQTVGLIAREWKWTRAASARATQSTAWWKF